MTIMLVHWWEFIYYFLLYVIRRHDNYLRHFSTSHILHKLLIISLKPNILVEFGEGERESKVIFNS
jgi:hypothetical protein